MCYLLSFLFFFFTDTATTEIYTLSLHDALPILSAIGVRHRLPAPRGPVGGATRSLPAVARASIEHPDTAGRSEEHTSELQSRRDLVCRLLLEKKKNKKTYLAN